MSEANTSYFPGRVRWKPDGAVVFCLLAMMVIGAANCGAEEITTLDGKKYEEVSDIKNLPDAILFSHTTTTGVHRAKVFFSNLSAELKQKYNYDPFEEGFYLARQNKPVTLGLNKAFRLSDLAAAKKRAQAEKKLIGFVMVWDSMFGPGQPMGQGGRNSLAGFYTVFNKALVLVFVRHEDELDKVPEAVKKGFFGPDEGGWAPNMAVVTADCSQFVCEIPLGGGESDGLVREKVFRPKIAEIRKFVESQKPAK